MTDVYHDFQKKIDELRDEAAHYITDTSNEFREEVTDVLSHFGFTVKNEVIPELGPEGELNGPGYTSVTYELDQLPYDVRVKYRDGGKPTIEVDYNGDGTDPRNEVIPGV